MTDQVGSLIEALRKGDFEDPDDKVELLAAALVEDGGAPLDLLLKLLSSPLGLLRRAALPACRGRTEPELIQRLREMVGDEDDQVREALANALSRPQDKALIAALQALCRDRESSVQIAALRAICPALQAERADLLLTSDDWSVRKEAAKTLEARPDSIATLFQALARDSDEDVQKECVRNLEAKLGENPGMVGNKAPQDQQLIERAEKNLLKLGTNQFPKLVQFLRERTAEEVSAEELAGFGADLTKLAREGGLPRSYCVDALVGKLAEVVFGKQPSSVVILGEPGVGKTALVHEFVHWVGRPENGGWHVLRMGPADFVVGTVYLGEWETKVAKLVKAIRRPRRVILYVPSIGELPGIGRHSKSDHNVMTALLPHLQDGSILLLGEGAVAEFERGFRQIPAARSLLKLFLLEQPDQESTAGILRHVRDAAGSSIPNEQIEQIIELADQFLPGQARPGNAARLFHSVQTAEGKLKAPVATRHILEALASSSGLPVDLLDDDVPLDLAAVRSFFEARVLGQAEAINAVVELVTLIKAGLTDPMKPMGVFLFVGPTGVGKTELTRALAEYIFGDTNRLLRFDMSEYATAEAFQRLLDSDQRGSLTNLVRQTPFSVVLLDVIEKSNLNVFDLCLQLFDAGRLTDNQGRTTDFRRTILVLTSNVGAAKPTFSPIGFRHDGRQARPEKEETFRELSHFFRPEFLNRIDRIVYFSPLELEVAESIARKEIERVLGRTGIRRRKLAVEVDPSVLCILLKEGYSPAFGARPLKRAVEKLLLQPVARIIASGRHREASLLRLTAVEGRIEPQLIPRQDAPADRPSAPPKDTRDLRERALEVQEELAEAMRGTTAWDNRKTALLAQTRERDFYQNPAQTALVFDEIHRLDQFLTFVSRTEAALAEFQNHLAQSGKGTKSQLENRLGELRRQVWCAHKIAGSREAGGTADALVEVSLAQQDGEKLDMLEKLVQALVAYGARLPLSLELMAEGIDAPIVYLRATGVGACALLSTEAGLHEFSRAVRQRTPRTGRELLQSHKELLRVTIRAMAEQPVPAALKIKAQPARTRAARLLEGDLQEVSVFDPASARSLRLLARGPKSDAVSTVTAILLAQGQPALFEPAQAKGVIRRYELGIGSKARDLRSGATTPHLDKLFKGQFELLNMRAPMPAA